MVMKDIWFYFRFNFAFVLVVEGGREEGGKWWREGGREGVGYDFRHLVLTLEAVNTVVLAVPVSRL